MIEIEAPQRRFFPAMRIVRQAINSAAPASARAAGAAELCGSIEAVLRINDRTRFGRVTFAGSERMNDAVARRDRQTVRSRHERRRAPAKRSGGWYRAAVHARRREGGQSAQYKGNCNPAHGSGSFGDQGTFVHASFRSGSRQGPKCTNCAHSAGTRDT